ncbi:ABC transporter ATP-binding protein [Campylobacter mucosalis]|uniref:ABC transporter, ATP-binding protein n=1 Tax=Campylobacter mucosalis CCUG 21559 TaxID=1032067 RepID=A0A6G5QI26_9BACT|nr:ABC transporter ATP-binding protein [Campylobacter mucosalis]QCD45345.1 ABC transporter, ATP-binding protein [Campylobacter mucosalis CCUG 21559]
MFNFIKKVNFIFGKKDRQGLFFIFLFSLFVSFVELFAISLIMPFVAIVNDSNYIFNNKILLFIYNLFNFKVPTHFTVFVGICLILFYCFRAIILMLYTYVTSRFTEGRYSEISQNIFKKLLHLSYVDFTNIKESDISKSIINEAHNICVSINNFLTIVVELMITVCIYVFMLYVDFKLTIFITLMLFVAVFVLLKIVSPRLKKYGKHREENQKQFFDTIYHVFNNYKMFKISTIKQHVIKENFKNASNIFRKSTTRMQFLNNMPRIFLETIMFLVLISIALFIVLDDGANLSERLHILSFMLLGMYRMVPSTNRILNSYGYIAYHHRAVDVIYEIYNMKQENFKNNGIDFKNEIRLNNLSFSYDNHHAALKNINLSIKKGSKIAIVGPSGSGKSTMIDIIMGLIVPSKNTLFVDGVGVDESNLISWRNKIAYVPQGIYLFDASIAENIYFGNNRDDDKIVDVLKKVCLYDFVMGLKDGVETNVGSNGVKLSGGQRQRIAIARTLYNDYDILILDEATSALDEKTEKTIMHEILSHNKDQTIIIVTHRLSSIKDCDYIYEVKNGLLSQI